MIVHLGWVGSEVPQHVLSAADAVRRVASCPVMLHVDEQDVPGRWREAMDSMSLRPHMRSDVQRHAVLRRYGGLWLDADVRVLADPVLWTAGWDRYTAIRLRQSPAMIGTDILYVPAGWDGWPLIEAEIDRVLAKTAETRRVGVLALAHRLIDNCQRRRPAAFAVLEPGTRFPFMPATFTTDSVVARGFDPPADPPPGLGDMVKAGLSAVGITEDRVSRAIGRPCGCGKRAARLNELGHRYLGLPPGRATPAT